MPVSLRARHFAFFLALIESLETSWNTPVEPLWSDPIGADLANAGAAMMWVLDQGDAEGALRMAVGLDRFWIFSVPLSVRPPGVAGSRARSPVVAVECHWHPREGTGVRPTRCAKGSN